MRMCKCGCFCTSLHAEPTVFNIDHAVSNAALSMGCARQYELRKKQAYKRAATTDQKNVYSMTTATLTSGIL
jgi:hypothetical protein